MYGYRVVRDTDKTWFEGRDDYVTTRGRRAGDDRRFCNAVAAALSGRSGFPWVTFVIGSGAPAVADEPGLNSTSIAATVRSLLNEALSDPDSGLDDVEPIPTGDRPGLPLAVQAERFTQSLAHDRLQEADKSSQRSSGSEETITPVWEIEPVAAQLVLAAALLTKWFDLVRAESNVPLSRWDDESAVLAGATKELFDIQHLWNDVLEPAILVMDNVVRLLEDGRTRAGKEVANAVIGLLGQIAEPLQQRAGRRHAQTLRVEQLRLLTEVCWHFLLLHTSVYPGWTDLLLRLMLQEKYHEGYRRIRPRYSDLQKLPKHVMEFVLPATEHSWRLSRPVGDGHKKLGPRDGFYAAVGEVLWSQSSFASTEDAPPPVAYATSFDLEVEMGLWHTGVDRTDRPVFNVVVPVHVFRHPEADAEPCWLMGEVNPNNSLDWDEQLATLRKPRNWRLLRSDTPITGLQSRPTVVHLSGCPLLDLPAHISGQLVAELKQVGITTGPGSQIAHAVTVDEYLALRQSEAEFFWMSHHEADPDARRGRGLPQELTTDGANNPRFWMALGVPIGDPAVRHRLVSQMTLRRVHLATTGGLTSPSGAQAGIAEAPPEGSLLGTAPRVGLPGGPGVDDPSDPIDVPERRSRTDAEGIVVNKRISDDEASLLYWLGLDVIRDDCLSFVDDLHHYVKHLEAPVRDRVPRADRPCQVSGTRGLA